MRRNLVHPRAGELKYEIRGIVDFADQLEKAGIGITWENIGDPVAKGEEIPSWIRDIVADAAKHDLASYAYSPTKGLLSARTFLAGQRNRQANTTLSPDDILFFNGLGDAIANIYQWLNPAVRVLGPDPAYPTHSSLEAAHNGSVHPVYKLNPDNNWLPDMAEVRKQVAADQNIAGLLVINPGNPTSTIIPQGMLEEFVTIAREYQLFLIADEVYANLVYDPRGFTSLAAVAGGVPTMVLRGLSKEVPWPGARCGWVEFYNSADPIFARYRQSIEEAKMTEVCSTTLPQTVLPALLGDKRYEKHLQKRRERYAARANQALKLLDGCEALRTVPPQGAFYLSVTFSEDFMKQPVARPAANPVAQKLLDAALASMPADNYDKRFCYQLMAATGICVVPLSTGFNSSAPGFRMTLLEPDDAAFARTLQTIKEFCA